MSPLQSLITGRMREQGWEPKDVEARGVKHATLHRYMNPVELRQLPRRDVLESLAEGLVLPYDRVLQAAKDTVGWTAGQSAPLHAVPDSEPDVPDLIAAVRAHPGLLPEAKEHLINQIGLLLRVQAAAGPDAVRAAYDEQLHAELAAQPTRTGKRPRRP